MPIFLCGIWGILNELFMLVLQGDSEPSPQPHLLETGSCCVAQTGLELFLLLRSHRQASLGVAPVPVGLLSSSLVLSLGIVAGRRG